MVESFNLCNLFGEHFGRKGEKERNKKNNREKGGRKGRQRKWEWGKGNRRIKVGFFLTLYLVISLILVTATVFHKFTAKYVQLAYIHNISLL